MKFQQAMDCVFSREQPCLGEKKLSASNFAKSHLPAGFFRFVGMKTDRPSFRVVFNDLF